MKNYLLMILAIVPGAFAQQALSQTTAAAAAEPDSLAEIVVTAEKTETSAQKTPISLAVYSGQDLVDRGVNNIADLVAADSSMTLTYSTGMPIIAIRGVSSGNVTEIGDPAVSIGTDGVFINRPYGVFGGLYDIARVEILRGPQGTLFGRNSTGGSVDVITQRPTDKDEAGVTGEFGNYNLVEFQGFGNTVIADGLDMRFSFLSRSHAGYRDNAPVNLRGDDADLHSARLQLSYEPSSSLKMWLLGQYTYSGGVGQVNQIVPFNYINGVGGEPVHSLPGGIGDGSSFPFYSQNDNSLRVIDLRGSVVYTFPDAISLTYLGGYNEINYLRVQSINPFYLGTPATPIVPFIYENREKPTTINQELRLASAPGDRLSWQAGIYYFGEVSSVNAQTIANPQGSNAGQGIAFLLPKVDASSRAAFGQIGFAFTDAFKVTAGARFTDDSRLRTGTFVLDPLQTGLPFVLNLPDGGSASSSKTTWSLDAAYQLTPINLLYAKASTGYKAGGFNNAESQYGPETVISYEMGSKNRFLDNHLEFNVDAYLMDYKDQQVTQFVAGPQSSGSITVNAGRSRIYGLESSLAYQDDKLGRLQLSANYLHARYTQFQASAGWDSSINLDLAGNTPPLSPTASISGQYEYPITIASGATITPRVSFKYQSKVYFVANNYPDETQGGYGLLDLGMDYVPQKGNWRVTGYVQNVANKHAFSDASEFYTFNNYELAYIPPMTYGLRFNYKF
jgi:iron complex outermembrane receptor protein